MSHRFGDSLWSWKWLNQFRPDPDRKLSASLYDVYHYLRPGPARKLSANLCDIYHCCVYSEELLMMDRGTVRNM